MIFGITREAVAQREMEYGLQGAALQATANAIIITDREGVVFGRIRLREADRLYVR